MNYKFEVIGCINAVSSDDAMDIVKMILEDHHIIVNKVNVFGGRGESVSLCKQK